MKGYRLVVRHDGDFYHERPYNIVIHDDESEAIRLVIEALQKVHDTFRTSRTYLKFIKDHIGKFLEAYRSDEVSYVDDRFDIWFVRQGEMFEFEFDLDNGNQRIHIEPYIADIKLVDNAIYINEDKSIGGY